MKVLLSNLLHHTTMTSSTFTCCFYWLVFVSASALALSNGYQKRISIITGANGYVGREIVNVLLSDKSQDNPNSSGDECNDEILCLVRRNRIESETEYWKRFQSSQVSSTKVSVKVLPYDMLDGGKTITDALNNALEGTSNDETNDSDESNPNICVYHIASVFGPTDDHITTAKENVQGTKDLVEALGNFSKSDCCRLVFTSSMAAVRGSGQTPKNGEYYTYHDWNTKSKLEDNNWGSSYQWSKAESERVAWEIAGEMNIPMTTICPSFVFGPPTGDANGESDANLSSSFSITLFGQWVRGESPVQSRLFVDVRDVAKAHVLAVSRPEAINQRIIVSTEARMPSQEMAKILKEVCEETGLSDPENVSFDGEFKGGAIPIGTREVEATSRINDVLGLDLTPVQETIRDMGRSLLFAKGN
uniref:NAD-dependent epimerase/dehydratase domain-containing protein n=1 Tax=Pseudo-nitzschia australis TaxID=44445 RepID=A0A7S4A9I1_9STRA